MSFLYHAYVVYEHMNGTQEQWDGTISCSGPVNSPERFQKLRGDIAKATGFKLDRMFVKSITLLWNTPESNNCH